ncbi:MAG: hypothetical protein N2V78_12285 [Methanophagales archaeon]|nr:hypothetical protein [Methanophagales archaeon]MCW3140856.1 hypothetical protein [Methanophagales archaeon]
MYYAVFCIEAGYGERWRVYLASKLKRVVAVGVISYLRFSEQIVF